MVLQYEERGLKMKRVLFVLLCIAANSALLFANGGIHWWANGSGTKPAEITLKNDSDIVLKKENLTLRFVDDSVIVVCDYVLFNRHSSEKQIDFAFNVTEASRASSLNYYNISVDGIKLESEFHLEKVDWGEERSYKYWELSKIKLASNKETNVSICYRIETSNDGTYYRSLFRDNSFVYNLFPALSFGDGIIEDFTLTVDASDIFGWNGKISKIEGIDIAFSGSERIVTKSFKNFDLNKHKQLKISYNIKNFYFAKLYEKYGTRFFGISAASELKEGSTIFSASNLLDGDCNTAWVEAKDDFGKNEKIKIESVHGNELITQLLLVNGFRKSSKTYYENNRVKKIALYVDGIRLGEMTFPDRPYHPVNMSNILDEGELLNLCGDFFASDTRKTWTNAAAFHVDKNIEIEILEVYPGTKYNDTCISDIYLIKAELPIP